MWSRIFSFLLVATGACGVPGHQRDREVYSEALGAVRTQMEWDSLVVDPRLVRHTEKGSAPGDRASHFTELPASALSEAVAEDDRARLCDLGQSGHCDEVAQNFGAISAVVPESEAAVAVYVTAVETEAAGVVLLHYFLIDLVRDTGGWGVADVELVNHEHTG